VREAPQQCQRSIATTCKKQRTNKIAKSQCEAKQGNKTTNKRKALQD